jgi:hypothetical protein
MARPPTHGKDIESQDAQDLQRILRRVHSDTKRPSTEREALAFHLKSALAILWGFDLNTDSRTKAKRSPPRLAKVRGAALDR